MSVDLKKNRNLDLSRKISSKKIREFSRKIGYWSKILKGKQNKTLISTDIPDPSAVVRYFFVGVSEY